MYDGSLWPPVVAYSSPVPTVSHIRTHFSCDSVVLLTSRPLSAQVVLADARAVEQLRSLHQLVTRRHQQHQRRGAQRTNPASRTALHLGRSNLRQFGSQAAAAAGVLTALGIRRN